MIRILEHQTNLIAELLHIIVFIVDIFTVHIDMTARGMQKSVQKLCQRRLSGTGVSNDSDKLSLFNL